MADDSIVKNRPHSVKGVMVDQRMLIPSADLVAKHIEKVPEGQTRSLAQLRAAMAADMGAEASCPVTTQRMIKVVATKSVSDHAAGQTAVPFWRVVDPTKSTSKSLAGGSEFIVARRKEEAF